MSSKTEWKEYFAKLELTGNLTPAKHQTAINKYLVEHLLQLEQHVSSLTEGVHDAPALPGDAEVPEP